MACVCPLHPLNEVLRIWVGRVYFTVDDGCISTAMVPVQMGINHDIDLVWSDTKALQSIDQAPCGPLKRPIRYSARIEFVPQSGINQDVSIIGTYQETGETLRNQISTIRFGNPTVQRSGH